MLYYRESKLCLDKKRIFAPAPDSQWFGSQLCILLLNEVDNDQIGNSIVNLANYSLLPKLGHVQHQLVHKALRFYFEQAGAELCQAELKLGLDFNSINLN